MSETAKSTEKGASKTAASKASADSSKSTKDAKDTKNTKKLLIIRLRGLANRSPQEEKTLETLKLLRRNACVVVKDTKGVRQMLKIIGHLVTWGELKDDEVEKAITKKASAQSGVSRSGMHFTGLAPPKGGLERKGIKRTFAKGGALGYRGEKIAELAKKML